MSPLPLRVRIVWAVRDWWDEWGRVPWAIAAGIVLGLLLTSWRCAHLEAPPPSVSTPSSAPAQEIRSDPLPGDFELPKCPGDCSARARFVLAPERPAPAAGAPATFAPETIPWAVLPSSWIEAPRPALVSFEELARPDLVPGREPLWAEAPRVTHETYVWGIDYIEAPTSPVPEPAMWIFLLVGVPFGIFAWWILTPRERTPTEKENQDVR